MGMFKSVMPLVLAVWFLQLAGGILVILTPVGLQAFGLSATGIGLVASLHAVGFMLGAYLSPGLISDVGNIRIFAAAAALTASTAIAQGLWVSTPGWALLRLLQGVGFALMFASIESWLGRAVPPRQRGNILGFYNFAAKVALFCGPFIVAGAIATDPEAFLWPGLFLAVALIPICMTRTQEPVRLRPRDAAYLRLFRQSPSAVIGVFLAGLINTGVFALLPLYAAELNEDAKALALAAMAYGAANIGGLLSQWPAGRLSDRFERRTVIALMCALSGGAAGLLFSFGHALSMHATLILLGVWGAGSLSFYGVCVAHGADRVDDEDMTSLMSMLLLIWAFGSILGPVIAGVTMRSPLGADGLFAFAAAGLFLVSTIMLVRRLHKIPVPDPEQTNWQPVMPAGLPGGDLDPRT